MVKFLTEYFEIFACSRFFKKNAISGCKLRLLEPFEQPQFKMKMFFEREMFNSNN